MTLDIKDRDLIPNALRVAAEVYQRDAKTMRESVGETHPIVTQFVTMQSACERLAEAFEEHDTVVLG